MTRFWIKIEDAALFVLSRIPEMQGGEIFIPHMKAAFVTSLLRAVFSDGDLIRKVNVLFEPPRIGEKDHECMISEEEARYTVDFENHSVIDVKRNPYCPNNGPYISSKAQRYSDKELIQIVKEVLENE